MLWLRRPAFTRKPVIHTLSKEDTMVTTLVIAVSILAIASAVIRASFKTFDLQNPYGDLYQMRILATLDAKEWERAVRDRCTSAPFQPTRADVATLERKLKVASAAHTSAWISIVLTLITTGAALMFLG
jgi:hypothetical protein